MAIKGVKRSVEKTDASLTPSDNKQQSKKKIKIEKIKTEVEANGFPAKKQIKEEKNKKKSAVNDKNTSEIKSENSVASTKNIKTETTNVTASNEAAKNGNDGAKVAALIKQKAKRKATRQKFNGYVPELIKATPEQLNATIQNILSREIITKTARRRLAVLRKKLNIKLGTYTPTPKPVATMGKSEKRKLRRQKNALNINSNTEDEKSPIKSVKSKAEEAANAVKGIKLKAADKKELNKTKKIASKETKNMKIEAVEKKIKMKKEKIEKIVAKKESEKDDDDEEDEDEEQNESMDVSNNSTNTLNGNDDDDDDEDDDDAEIGETEKPLSKTKTEKKMDNKSEKKVMENGEKKQKSNKKNPNESANQSPKKTRYVLFVGNLPYDATVDDIKKHFLTKVSEVLSVRIPLGPQNNPRGFAYVEFSNNVDYEKGLSLHESNINGRRINVQYSQSGSKDVGKRSNIVAKNNKLHALRKQGMLAGSTKDSQKRNARRNKQKNSGA